MGTTDQAGTAEPAPTRHAGNERRNGTATIRHDDLFPLLNPRRVFTQGSFQFRDTGVDHGRLRFREHWSHWRDWEGVYSKCFSLYT